MRGAARTCLQHKLLLVTVALADVHALGFYLWLRERALACRPCVRPTSLTLSCTAKAHVPKVARRDGCAVRAAISGARKVAGGVPPSELCSHQALQRRDEAGP